jgi:spore photoproduct lyase
MKKLIEKVERKSLLIRPSGRSTDYIAPSFGFGCLYNCAYCYMKRHKPEGLTIADQKSTTNILTEINSHAWFDSTEKPNQTHPEYISYDISCNEDFALHAKHHEWQRIFEFFRDHPKAMGSFATKYVNEELLKFNPKKKVRIRFSMMPEILQEILEPNTSSISERLSAIRSFLNAGYEVHLNFSPVIVYDNWLEDYAELFKAIEKVAKENNWDNDNVKAEVIFLTHNNEKHLRNLEDNLPGEELLWTPEIQEDKISQYGGKNVRYKSGFKAEKIKEFVELHNSILPWNTIRYVF